MNGFGIVVSGVGARAAYEVGVLLYLFRDLARSLERPPWPDAIAACNAGVLAVPGLALGSVDEIGRVPDLLSRFEASVSLSGLISRYLGGGSGGLLRSPFESVIEKHFPAERIHDAVQRGAVRLVGIAVAEPRAGSDAIFVEAPPDLPLFALERATLVRTAVRREHAVATLSIPVLYSPREIDGRTYSGGVRQLRTMLLPLEMAGVDRVLMVDDGSRFRPEPPDQRRTVVGRIGESVDAAIRAEAVHITPRATAGVHVTVETTKRELLVTEIVKCLSSADFEPFVRAHYPQVAGQIKLCGAELALAASGFVEALERKRLVDRDLFIRLSEVHGSDPAALLRAADAWLDGSQRDGLEAAFRGAKPRPIDDAALRVQVIRPSTDLTRLARDFARSRRASSLLRRVTEETDETSSLASLLLYDEHFLRELVELGRADARQLEELLAAITCPEPSGG